MPVLALDNAQDQIVVNDHVSLATITTQICPDNPVVAGLDSTDKPARQGWIGDAEIAGVTPEHRQ